MANVEKWVSLMERTREKRSQEESPQENEFPAGVELRCPNKGRPGNPPLFVPGGIFRNDFEKFYLENQSSIRTDARRALRTIGEIAGNV